LRSAALQLSNPPKSGTVIRLPGNRNEYAMVNNL
jgi:hypothetical protein